MTVDMIRPLAAEIAVLLLAVVVLVLGLAAGAPAAGDGRPGRRIGWVTLIGLLVVLAVTFGATEGQSVFGGTYVEDGLSLFAKRLFLAAASDLPRLIDADNLCSHTSQF